MPLVHSLLIASLATSTMALAQNAPCPPPIPSEPEQPWTASPRREDYPWMSRVEWCQRFESLLKDPARVGAQLVFMGDSITQGWTDLARDVWDASFGSLHPLRLGIGGDRTQNLLWRMEQGELDGLNPRVLVLLIGINNLNAGNAPEDVVHGIEAVVDAVHARLPGTRILLLGLLPSGGTPEDALRLRIRSTNDKLQTLSRPWLSFQDVGGVFLKSDGQLNIELLPDGLHPGHEGYRVFAEALKPSLKDLFAADVVNVSAIEK